MITARTPAEARGYLLSRGKAGVVTGFVPTMGALHRGHESLLMAARERSDLVVASIFVNPAQFGPEEDFGRYPRTLDEDKAMLERCGCDMLFAPPAEEIYSKDDRTTISVARITGTLCGASRPGHFEGVLLIVAKLFNIVRPDLAFFGQKDAQQAVVIQRMAADLDFPVRIALVPTVREEDGLAVSSRNRYLGPVERRRAAAMYAGLREAVRLAGEGEREPAVLESAVASSMERAGFDIDYAGIVDAATMKPVPRIEGRILIAAAGRLGRTRLIDNVALDVSDEDVSEILLEFPEWSRYGSGT